MGYTSEIKILTLTDLCTMNDRIPDLMLIKRLQFVLVAMTITAGLSSYYGDINVSCEFQGHGCYDADSINIFVFHSAEVNQQANGITAFPDSGIPKILLKKVTICRFSTLHKSLVTIMDYGSLPYSSNRWKFNLLIRNIAML